MLLYIVYRHVFLVPQILRFEPSLEDLHLTARRHQFNKDSLSFQLARALQRCFSCRPSKLLPGSQGRNLALTVLYVPYSFDSGHPNGYHRRSSNNVYQVCVEAMTFACSLHRAGSPTSLQLPSIKTRSATKDQGLWEGEGRKGGKGVGKARDVARFVNQGRNDKLDVLHVTCDKFGRTYHMLDSQGHVYSNLDKLG